MKGLVIIIRASRMLMPPPPPPPPHTPCPPALRPSLPRRISRMAAIASVNTSWIDLPESPAHKRTEGSSRQKFEEDGKRRKEGEACEPSGGCICVVRACVCAQTASRSK